MDSSNDAMGPQDTCYTIACSIYYGWKMPFLEDRILDIPPVEQVKFFSMSIANVCLLNQVTTTGTEIQEVSSDL